MIFNLFEMTKDKNTFNIKIRVPYIGIESIFIKQLNDCYHSEITKDKNTLKIKIMVPAPTV